ncbi:putative toxin-antitoxin system antitoxin component, TIGR02293 family [Ulvibacter litoralis]|uniref:Putative toxin-antitoxin system antitoxin component, TIGR02293 family n=2 Tax=Ulvibacter litoralis TaxID=227084 RepID=A0A1G7GPV8_9FLAO|nr:putative toxin-antitoxin system antitoxin component, TIGR02293 family [Ulvibacter litoralis]
MTNVVIMRSLKIQNLVKEPKAFYGLQNKYDRIVSVLGGSVNVGHAINNDIDLIEITRKGLPKSVVATIGSILGISMERMSNLIHVSHRTIQRKHDDELLNVYSTEQILEIAEVISRGIEVLGSIEAFTAWLHKDLRALNYGKPLDFLDTSFGTNLIKDILGRIEHGVY